jgi:hypothetical protein
LKLAEVVRCRSRLRSDRLNIDRPAVSTTLHELTRILASLHRVTGSDRPIDGSLDRKARKRIDSAAPHVQVSHHQLGQP